MKNVRLYFRKNGRMKFISHLDMNRFMLRIIRKINIPIWYTEGFNPHPYVTFALPLSLGFESDYEIMDIRLNDDGFDESTLVGLFNSACPEGIKFFDAKPPILKTGAITYAEYDIVFNDNGEIKAPFEDFMSKGSILCKKRTKKGDMKEIDLKCKIKAYNIYIDDCNNTHIKITLPAGGNENLNPELLLNAYFEAAESYCFSSVKRIMIYDGDLNPFR